MSKNSGQYPITWKATSWWIREVRAQRRCECMGECGLHHSNGPRRCIERHREPAKWAKGTVILTTAHLCACDPLCDNIAHLKAMCNRCHLRLDIKLHTARAAATRRKKKEAIGQLPLGVL